MSHRINIIVNDDIWRLRTALRLVSKCRNPRPSRHSQDTGRLLAPDLARSPNCNERMLPIRAAACTREGAEIDVNPLSVCLRESSGEDSYCCRTAI